MQLLPLVEMYCKWELQEDCTDLYALVLRFDSELELDSHELGRLLLAMVRDDDDDFVGLKQQDPAPWTLNPFDVVRERLEAAHIAIRDDSGQVPPHIFLHFWLCLLPGSHST